MRARHVPGDCHTSRVVEGWLPEEGGVRVLRGLGAVGLIAVVVIAIVVVGGLAWITGRGQAPASGSIALAGLDAPVTIARDINGIVQITAETPHDLFVAQGWVHASERLWQMEVWRHIGAGRLSELFGSSQVETDAFVRTLGWRRAAERDLAALSPGTREILGWYADGVNAFIEGRAGALGLPFVVAGALTGEGEGLDGYTPEPWTPLDTATWQKVQAWNLAGEWRTEIVRMLLDDRLGDPARTDQLTPPYPDGAPIVAPSELLAEAGGTAAAEAAGDPDGGVDGKGGSVAAAGDSPRRLTADERTGLRRLAAIGASIPAIAGLDAGGALLGDRGIGSNDWVVAPERSATGRALLGNDPHLGVSNPSVWFMNGLHCRSVSDACPWDVVGVSFPGAPAVILGHNARIAWGATNVGPDVQDLFIERADPADPSRYLTESGSEPFVVREETIAVRGGEPVTITIRETRHGPVVNDLEPLLEGSDDLFAVRWTATADADRTYESFLDLNLASDWDDFRAALASYVAPSQNFVYADVDGHIGWQVPGWIPVRAGGDPSGRPVPGWDGAHEWTGRVPFDELPRLFDPPAGLIVTANNAVVDDAYPHFIGRDWDPGDRAARILEALEARAADGGVRVEDVETIQMDARVLRAGRLVPSLAGIEPATEDGRRVLGRIRTWDTECGVDSLGCAAYMAFELALQRAMFDDDLGPELAREYVGQAPSWPAVQALLADPDDPFWDDTTTPVVERAPDILRRALDTAGATLRADVGDPARWVWGRLHTVTFAEPTLGSSGIGPLEWYFTQGPYPVGGAAGAPDNTYWQADAAYPDPDDPDAEPAGLETVFSVTNLPSYRLAVDMGDLDGARIVITTGNSGHPFSAHYGDLIDEWRTGRTVPLPFSPAAIEAATTEVLTLTP